LVPRNAGVFFLGLIVAVSLCHHAGPVHQLSRALGAAAFVSEEAADALVGFIGVTSNASFAAFSWAIATLSASQSLSHEIWCGLELNNVSLATRAGQVGAVAPEIVVEWLRSAEAARLVDGPPEVLQYLSDAVAGLALGMAQVSFERKIWTDNSTYAVLKITAHATPSGDTEVSWLDHRANFTIAWSNPLWAALDFELPSDLTGPIGLVKQYLQALPGSRPQISQAYLVPATITQIVGWRLLRGQRQVGSIWRKVVSWIPGYGGRTNESGE